MACISNVTDLLSSISGLVGFGEVRTTEQELPEGAAQYWLTFAPRFKQSGADCTTRVQSCPHWTFLC